MTPPPQHHEQRLSAVGPQDWELSLGGTKLNVFTYRASLQTHGLMVLFHGNSGNAVALRDFAIPLARRLGLLIVAPLFDKKSFPPVRYQRGNITDGRGKPHASDLWTTRLAPQLVDWAMDGGHMPYWLWGFSAGGQYLSRVAAFQPLRREPERIIIVSPSSHVQPLLGRWPAGERAPYGLGGIFPPQEEAAALRHYLARPITLCVGDEDRERTDPSLGRSRAARRQGPDRLARAAKTFDTGAMAALRTGQPFNWRLEVIPGVGHAASDMLAPSIAAPIMVPPS